jgi:hypothetical protein
MGENETQNHCGTQVPLALTGRIRVYTEQQLELLAWWKPKVLFLPRKNRLARSLSCAHYHGASHPTSSVLSSWPCVMTVQFSWGSAGLAKESTRALLTWPTLSTSRGHPLSSQHLFSISAIAFCSSHEMSLLTFLCFVFSKWTQDYSWSLGYCKEWETQGRDGKMSRNEEALKTSYDEELKKWTSSQRDGAED